MAGRSTEVGVPGPARGCGPGALRAGGVPGPRRKRGVSAHMPARVDDGRRDVGASRRPTGQTGVVIPENNPPDEVLVIGPPAGELGEGNVDEERESVAQPGKVMRIG